MSKLMIAMPSDKTPPLYDFFNDELNEKQRQKLLSLFALMLQAPVSVMREPYPGFSISAPAKCGHLCDERKRCCI